MEDFYSIADLSRDWDCEQDKKNMLSLFATARINYQSLNGAGIIVDVNDFWLQSLGYAREEVIGRWFGDFLSEPSRILFKDSFESFCFTKEIKDAELELVCKNENLIVASFNGLWSTDEDDKLIRSHCIFQNVTKLKKADEIIHREKFGFSTIAELVDVGIFEYDSSKKTFTYLNKKICDTLGLTSNSIHLRDFFPFLSSETQKKLVKYRDDLRSGKIAKSEKEVFEIEILNKDKKWLNVKVTNRFYTNEKGELIVYGVLEDITESKVILQDFERKHSALKNITDNAPVVLFQYCIKGKEFWLLELSDNIYEHTGYTKEWLTKKHKNFSKLLHPDDRAMLIDTVLTPFQIKSPKALTFRIIAKNGEIKWIRIHYSFSKIDNNNTWTGIALDISEEQKLKKELGATTLKYSEILNTSVSVIIEASLTGFIKSVSKSITNISGYLPEELIGKHFLKTKVSLPKDKVRLKTIFLNLAKGRIPEKGIEFEWNHKNGEIRFGEAFVNIIGENGKTKTIQLLLFDTSYKKRLELEESQRNKELMILFETSVLMQKIHSESDFYDFVGNKLHDLIPEAIINVNSVNDDLNQLKIEGVLGISRVLEKTVGKLLNDALKGYTVKIEPGAFDYAKPGKLETYNSSLFEMTMGEIPEFVCRQVEKLIGFDRSMEASLGTQDKILGGVAIFFRKGIRLENKTLIEAFLREASNVLIRIKVQNQLKKSELLHRSLAENTESLILRIDKDSNLIYMNPVAQRIMFPGTPLNQKLSLDRIGIQLENPGLFLEEIQTVLKTKMSVTASFPITNNGIIWQFDWFFYPEFSGAKIDSVLVYANDISEKKSLELGLAQSLEFQRKLYAILAHDLRTPFNSMLGFLNLLQKNYHNLSEEKRQEYIKILKLSADKAYDLLDSILLWSRDNEIIKDNKELCIIKDVIDDIEILNTMKLRDKNILLFKDFDPKTCINAEKNMLSAIFRNLISNAIKFSFSNSEILISVQEQDGNFIFQIKDNGVGMDISSLDLEKDIKSKFTKQGTAGEKGSGLGLSFVHEFVNRCSGKIWFESEIDKGTSVFILLPGCLT